MVVELRQPDRIGGADLRPGEKKRSGPGQLTASDEHVDRAAITGSLSLPVRAQVPEEFAVDTGRTPRGILGDHLEDQLTNLPGGSSAAADAFPHVAKHGPVQFGSCPMPADHGFRQDENECILPLRPETSNYNPEQFVERTKLRPGMLAFQHRELLAEGEVFQQQAAASAKDAVHGPEPESKEFKHGAKVIADRRVPGIAMLLILKADGIVTSHRLALNEL